MMTITRLWAAGATKSYAVTLAIKSGASSLQRKTKKCFSFFRAFIFTIDTLQQNEGFYDCMYSFVFDFLSHRGEWFKP